MSDDSMGHVWVKDKVTNPLSGANTERLLVWGVWLIYVFLKKFLKTPIPPGGARQP